MRIVPIAFSFTLLFLISSANAQNETVTVTANDMAGPWKIGLPAWTAIDISKGTRFGPVQENFCRISGSRDDLQISCLRWFGDKGVGDVSLDGNKIHIAWGSMMARFTIDAKLDTPGKFTGNYTFKLSGVAMRDADVLTGSKIVLLDGAPDAAGKSALLKKQLADIGAGTSFVPQPYLSRDLMPPAPGDLRPLGAVQVAQYLGKTLTTKENLSQRPGMDIKPPTLAAGAPPYDNDAFDIYAVEFDHGERICGIRQRDDGVVDGLHCI